jgi:hypothetical protein
LRTADKMVADTQGFAIRLPKNADVFESDATPASGVPAATSMTRSVLGLPIARPIRPI